MEVRVTRGAAPAAAKAWPAKSAYPIEVDGVLRGYLVNWLPGYQARMHKGWLVLSLIPGAIHAGGFNAASRLRDVARAYEGVERRDELIAKVPTLIAEGKLPVEAEAARITEEARLLHNAFVAAQAGIKARQEAEREARQERERQRHEAESRQRADEVEALSSIRSRLSSQLTNFEALMLEAVIVRLGGKPGAERG